MTDLPDIPEAAIRAACDFAWRYDDGMGASIEDEDDVRALLAAAAPHIGAAYLRRAAQTIRDRYPADIWADPTGPGDTPSRTGAHMCRRVAEQLDHMAKELETDRG